MNGGLCNSYATTAPNKRDQSIHRMKSLSLRARPALVDASARRSPIHSCRSRSPRRRVSRPARRPRAFERRLTPARRAPQPPPRRVAPSFARLRAQGVHQPSSRDGRDAGATRTSSTRGFERSHARTFSATVPRARTTTTTTTRLLIRSGRACSSRGRGGGCR